MEIKFYQNSDDKRVINKTLGTAKTLSSCQLIDESSIINPVIEIDIDTSLYAYNYAYIFRLYILQILCKKGCLIFY